MHRRFSQDTRTGDCILQVLEYMIGLDGISENTELTFDTLRENIEKSIPDDDFIHAVFYLTRNDPTIKALRQIIVAWDETNKTYVEISPQQFNECIGNNSYLHPITMKIVDANFFAEQVLTHFKPTVQFIQSLE